MSTVHITLGNVQVRALTGSTLPVEDGPPVAAETINSNNASSQQTTIAATAVGQIWTISAIGQDVWCNIGSNPTAASGSGRLITNGSTRSFAATAVGQKVAVRDVA